MSSCQAETGSKCRVIHGDPGVHSHGSFVATLGIGNRCDKATAVVQAQRRRSGLLGVTGLNVLVPDWKQAFSMVSNNENIDIIDIVRVRQPEFNPRVVRCFDEQVRKFFFYIG